VSFQASTAADQRVALITGCGKRIGIGSAAARALAAAGVAVIVGDAAPAGLSNDNEDADAGQSWRGLPSLVDEITTAGGKAIAVQCDVTSESDCRTMVGAALDSFGRVDILVNNAGAPHGRDRADLEEVPLEAWQRVMAVNAGGVFLMSKAVLPHMRAQGWGRMINIASSAVKYPLRHRATYSASKSAVVGFTQSLAIDLAPSGITVNAICPGSIRTTRAMSTARHTGWNDVEAGLAERAKSIPMGRHGSTEDIAALIVFLASEGSAYITGQSIYVDGGGVPPT
jgi:3-oxoacyl-[acyl-carrier protein] reductase